MVNQIREKIKDNISILSDMKSAITEFKSDEIDRDTYVDKIIEAVSPVKDYVKVEYYALNRIRDNLKRRDSTGQKDPTWDKLRWDEFNETASKIADTLLRACFTEFKITV